tara:strand:- start:8439 stop:9140 length:702 start_codon:yes stop_codon:yes gene_type:complete
MRKVIGTYQEDEPQNPFALSIGDLMAALLLIFILLLASTLLRLQDEFENKTEIAERYTATKEELYKELMIEFKAEIDSGYLSIQEENLAVRFSGPKIEFDFAKSVVKAGFKTILKDFFPRYVNIISDTRFKDNIEEIRIEGHTDNVGTYYSNMELSQNRTRSVLEFVIDSTMHEGQDIDWIKQNLTANGLSFSKPISNNDTDFGRSLNRRVEFRIRTNAEKQIDEILKINLDE